MKLSIVIPVFNEAKTISIIIEKVINAKIPGVTKEIIVVDDGSTDKTVSHIPMQKVKFARNNINQGKGAAVKKGIMQATIESLQEHQPTYDS